MFCTSVCEYFQSHMPKVFTSKSQRTGELGERIAVKLLEEKGFSIIERNYTKKWGEIDIIAGKDGILHFIEVKAKSVKDCKTIILGMHRPEEGMHSRKVARLKRTIQSYIAERNVLCEWKFDLVLVYMSDEQRLARVEYMGDLTL